MIDPKDAVMAEPDLAGLNLMEAYEQSTGRPRDDEAFYAVYSAADDYHLVGFVRGSHADRLPFTADSCCYASRLPSSEGRRIDTLRTMRALEGIPSWR